MIHYQSIAIDKVEATDIRQMIKQDFLQKHFPTSGEAPYVEPFLGAFLIWSNLLEIGKGLHLIVQLRLFLLFMLYQWWTAAMDKERIIAKENIPQAEYYFL